MTWHHITILNEQVAQFNLKSYWVRRKCLFNSIRGQFIMCLLRVQHNVTAGPLHLHYFQTTAAAEKDTDLFQSRHRWFLCLLGLSQIWLNPFKSFLLIRRGVFSQHPYLPAQVSFKLLKEKMGDFEVLCSFKQLLKLCTIQREWVIGNGLICVK